MYYITESDNKIMAWNCNGVNVEIINNTGYLPLCLKDDIVLMSNNKLYYIEIRRCELLDLEKKQKKIIH